MSFDLTIVIPGIRPQNWQRILNSIPTSIGEYSYEVIFSGPNPPVDDTLVTTRKEDEWIYLESYASPTKCVHEAAIHARGRLFTWASDDGVFMNDGLKEAIRFWDSDKGSKYDEVVMRYFEGVNFGGNYQGQPMDGPRASYWHAGHHPDLQLPHIPPTYKVAPLGMLSLEAFKFFGGFDCRFEHINMSPIDLSIRIQNHGGGVYLSPLPTLNCDFPDLDDNGPQRGPVIRAFFQNDRPLFRALYSNPGRPSILDFNNYQEAPNVWGRRFN